MRRWDQADLAKRIGYSQAVVSSIERGRVVPTEDQVARLGKAFGYSVEFLTADHGLLETTRPLLRAYSDASKRESDARVASCMTAVEYIRALALKPMPDLIPSLVGFDPVDEDSVEDMAAELRSMAGIEGGAVVSNMVRTAEKLGCVVLPFPSELGRHWGMSLRSDGLPIICVANSIEVPGDRQRFTVAHELAHLALHGRLPPPRDSIESSEVERQANQLAAAFLTPADALFESLEETGNRMTLSTLVEIKSVWGVSVKSLVGRFRELGRIDSDQARSLYKQISSRKWNKSEPVHVDRESARWLPRSLQQRANRSTLESATSLLASAIGGNADDLYDFASWDRPVAQVIPLERARKR
jgi:Zn-dependent peptidase ImmA (M78 family)/transcriptional regulator with XRE-family HTH domain